MTFTMTIQASAAGHVATVLLRRPPHNFVDLASMTELADALQALDADDNCRSIVLGSEGKSFCAGANFTAVSGGGPVLDSAGQRGDLQQFRAQALDDCLREIRSCGYRT